LTSTNITTLNSLSSPNTWEERELINILIGNGVGQYITEPLSLTYSNNTTKNIKYLNDGIIKCLYVHQIDRLGRNLRDVLNTAHTFTVKASPICFIAQGLRTIDEDGKENPISKLIISILGTIGEMERNQIRERQLEGISIAKAQGRFLGRKIW
jgi:hypothetical protein